MAADHGYDGVELAVTHDRRSQSVDQVRWLVRQYGVPVRSVHVPCFLLTSHVWGFRPEVKLARSMEMAAAVGADVVVTHPPFRWQRSHASRFASVVDRYDGFGGVRLAVENMFPSHVLGRPIEIFSETDASLAGFPVVTLDTSHAAASGADLFDVAGGMGSRLAHVHLSDSSRRGGDEHLPPGEGRLPLRDLANTLIADGFAGDIVIEAHLFRVARNGRAAAVRDARAWTLEAFAPASARASVSAAA